MTKKNSELDGITGVYMITNLINSKIYIGQSVNVRSRWMAHRRAKDTYISNAIKSYGFENFKIELLLECDISRLNFYETACIDEYNSCDRDIGYNLQSGGGNGNLHSEETKAKMRQTSLRNGMTKEHREKLNEANRMRWTPEMRADLAKNNKLKILSVESMAKRIAAFKVSMETNKEEIRKRSILRYEEKITAMDLINECDNGSVIKTDNGWSIMKGKRKDQSILDDLKIKNSKIKVIAKNLITGEIIYGANNKHLARLLCVGVGSIDCRTNNRSKQYTLSSINKIWVVSKLIK